MRPGPSEDTNREHKASADSASSPGIYTLVRAGSTCDSSHCTICQPVQPAYRDLQPGGASPYNLDSSSNCYSRAAAAGHWDKLERAASRSDVGGVTLKGGSPSQESSPASSQTHQHMTGACTAQLDDWENVSGRLSSEEDPTERWQRAYSTDDFVTIERSELRRGYASATSLALSTDSSPQKRQKRASVGYGEVTRDDMPHWVWNMEWERQPDPIPGQFQEVACFERPTSSQHKRHNADIVCGIEFSPDGWLLASAGVTKQIRVYPLADVRAGEAEGEPVRAVFIHRLPSKISSIAWDPFEEGIVTVGDYDGVVAQVHIRSGHLLADVDEYMGRRVWSVAHSQHRPHLCASSSDDGTAHLWAGRGLSERAGQIRLPSSAPISGVSFCAENEHALALAASDCCAYVYDVRNLTEPVKVLQGHDRPVSFAKFMGRNRLVTASVDSTLAMWNLDRSAGHLFRRYEGHRNDKNFVGLSVCPETELMATGSECGQAVAYHRAWARPVAAHDVCARTGSPESRPDQGPAQQHVAAPQEGLRPDQARVAGARAAPAMSELASAVCWWPAGLGAFGGRCGGPVLAAARSDGVLSLTTLVNAQ